MTQSVQISPTRGGFSIYQADQTRLGIRFILQAHISLNYPRIPKLKPASHSDSQILPNSRVLSRPSGLLLHPFTFSPYFGSCLLPRTSSLSLPHADPQVSSTSVHRAGFQVL